MVRDAEGAARVNRSEFVTRVAARANVNVKLATEVYDAVIEEIIQVVGEGKKLTLTGFGKFYPQLHKGHPVQRVNEDGRLEGTSTPALVDDYAVLKFSATRAVNRRIDPVNASRGGPGADADDES